jgi:SAM-dependent methyltransferase
MGDAASYIQTLYVSNPLMEPLNGSAIQALRLPAGSSGLDAGCGIGLQMPLLAEAVGPGGHVTGLDLQPEFLAEAERVAKECGLSGRVSFQQGDIQSLPFDDQTFDWLWSSNCAGYGTPEPLALVRELARVVKPGGIVSILLWSSQMLLPGYPLLEARLNATPTGIAPFTADMRPQSHWLCALGWFREAGLEETAAHTFVVDYHAPLSQEVREALASLLDQRWAGASSEVAPDDWAEYQRLCHPESPDLILDRPDYYAFFTESLFWGKVAR